MDRKVAVVGGCGHVGLPLGLSFAKAGLDVLLYDVDAAAVRAVSDGKIPFLEDGAAELLRGHLGKNLRVGSDAAALRESDVVVCVIGTPIDEHLNPQIDKLIDAVRALPLRSGQLFILRSTVFPGATAKLAAWMEKATPGIDVAFCPERVAQGQSIREIGSLPQLVAGVSPAAQTRATELFRKIAAKTIELSPLEAELGKLFCNAWRYISFAVANQFYTVCADNGVDYYRIWDAVRDDYSRMHGLPRAGLTAGPCLFKDTMQLAAFYADDFPLGQAAMRVNEGLPRFLVRKLSERFDLPSTTVGILGMAFKGDNDDTRDSLAFKLRKLLRLECKAVLCTDHMVRPREDLLPLETVLREADVLVIGAPHSAYRELKPTQPVLDPWNLLGRGGLVPSAPTSRDDGA